MITETEKQQFKAYLNQACDLFPRDYDYQVRIAEIMTNLYVNAFMWGYQAAKSTL